MNYCSQTKRARTTGLVAILWSFQELSQSVDKTVFVYIAVAWYDSTAKINVEGRNKIRPYNITVRRIHHGSELFLGVEISKFGPISKTKMARKKRVTM